jgi:HSP20 family molecular chaperone IbpA
MNKNAIVTIIGFALVGVIGYQAYLLDKTSDNPIFKNEPKITIEIEEPTIEKKVRELNKPQVQNNLDPKEMFDEKVIKDDLNKLFSDIFGNPKLQEGIKNGMKQMEEQLQNSFKEMENELGKFSKEFENLSQNDKFFKDILGNLGNLKGMVNANKLQFTDRGDNYYLKLDIPGGADSKIDIKTKENYLWLTITQKVIKETKNQHGTSHSESSSQQQNIIMIPADAFVDKLKTNYDNGVLEIMIPKVDKIHS